MQEQAEASRRIAAGAAARLAAARLGGASVGGGVRRKIPTGGHTAPIAPHADIMAMVAAAQNAANRIGGQTGYQQNPAMLQRQAALAASLRAHSAAAPQREYFEAELMVNDFAQSARYHVTHRETLATLTELTGAPRCPLYSTCVSYLKRHTNRITMLCCV